MTVNSRKSAWDKANVIFPTDYLRDAERSERAGYDVYYSTAHGVNAWISDLGNRLEVNLATGETVQIFIDEPLFSEYQYADALSIISDAVYEIDDKVNDALAERIGVKEARSLLYESYSKIAELLKHDFPSSDLFKRYNLPID